MAGARDAESVVTDYLGQFATEDPTVGPGPDARSLIRWLADEGWVLVRASPGAPGAPAG